jgi:drug/metabolite transporter (DMT)-like permease
MNFLKKTVIITLVLTFFVSTRAFADETMSYTLRSTLYGGAIGALLGTAVMLLTDNPEDNLSYIPTGAGIGLLAGAAYGLASSGVVQSISEVEGGKLTLKMPTVKRTVHFDKNVAEKEVMSSVDLFKFKF